MIRIIPGFNNYGVNENDQPCSLRKEGWQLLKDTGEARQRFCLHSGGRAISVSRQKFIFCATHSIDPRRIDGAKFVIDRNCELIEKAYKNLNLASERFQKLSKETVEKKEEKLKKTIKMAQLCIDALEGDAAPLLYELQKEKPYLLNIVKKGNSSFAVEIAIEQAELELLSALMLGRVTDPLRWIIKRASGILKDKSRFVRLDEFKGNDRED